MHSLSLPASNFSPTHMCVNKVNVPTAGGRSTLNNIKHAPISPPPIFVTSTLLPTSAGTHACLHCTVNTCVFARRYIEIVFCFLWNCRLDRQKKLFEFRRVFCPGKFSSPVLFFGSGIRKRICSVASRSSFCSCMVYMTNLECFWRTASCSDCLLSLVGYSAFKGLLCVVLFI